MDYFTTKTVLEYLSLLLTLTLLAEKSLCSILGGAVQELEDVWTAAEARSVDCSVVVSPGREIW